jgi:HTH-type transcriptional regulator / antitoxin MqsA
MADDRVGPESGLPLTRGMRPLVVSYMGRSATVEMPGWYRDGSDEALYDKDDLRVSDRALVTLKAQAQHLLTPDEVRDVRTRLGLTQADAGRFLGGGPRAFQKYESGEVLTSRAMTNLLLTLARHPKALDRIRREALAAEAEPKLLYG